MAKKGVKKIDPAIADKLVLTPCKTKDELSNWIKYHLGLHLPDKTVSRYADTNPLDAIWQIYKICVLKDNPEAVHELLYVAGRGSGKTLGVAIAELLVMLHDQRDVVHVGAILGQAKRCYEYQMGFMLNDKLKPVLNRPRKDPNDPLSTYRFLEKMNMEKSMFNLMDSKGEMEKVSLEVLPCTLKSVNGPHVPLVVVDEIDTVSGEGLKAFKDISGMLDSRGDKLALRVGISTRKTRYGLMNQQIEDAEAGGRTVMRWTAFEFAERCPDDRSGKDEVELYVNQDDMETISVEHYGQLDKQRQNEFFKEKFPGSGCASCPIAPICLGDAKKQTSKSFMLKPITDVIKKTMENGPDWALSQLMNLKPSVEGIIYKEFEERTHVKDWNSMWKILTSKEYPGVCTHDMFVRKCHSMGLQCYAGIDWGWTNPSTVVYFFVDSKENIYVVRCEGQTHTNNPSWAKIIKSKWHSMYRCQLYFADLANPGDGVTLRQTGLPCPTEVDKDVESGIQTMKKYLRVFGSPLPKLFFAKETCQPIIEEMGMYHFKIDTAGNITDQPAKEYDHWLDALRYGIYALFGKSAFVSSGGGMDFHVERATDSAGNFLRSPSAEEFAISQGLTFNANEVNENSLGKIGTLNELEADEDLDINGDGGFLWSF